MIYEIEQKNDFSTGASLTVKIPEHELDRKALYTIVADRPDFILPFRYRSVDGLIEFVYHVGSLSPFEHLPDSHTPKDCSELWFGILDPLLECGDWFMKPYSFILSTQHLYYDTRKKTVCYIYIPSTRECSDYIDLKDMAAAIASNISVDDAGMENKILRMIMKDFSPKEFLHMLKPYLTKNPPPAATIPSPRPQNAPELPESVCSQANLPYPEPTITETQESEVHTPGDIVINIPIDGESAKHRMVSQKDKDVLSGKKEKSPNESKRKESFFSRLKSAAQEEVVIG